MNSNVIITLQDLLKGRNESFDKTESSRIKFVRHKDTEKTKQRIIQGKAYSFVTLPELYKTDYNLFLKYQSEQHRDIFKEVDYLVSFLGEDGADSRFIGVYKNNGIIGKIDENNIYDIQEVEGFEILKERVIINWGGSALAWHQWYNNIKNVIRIDQSFNEFTSYNDVLLDYYHLKKIFETNDIHWRNRLECCNCVYLIQDKNNGKQYIGSTYNTKGIWGRWEQYAATGHGGDVELISLLGDDPQYAAKYFQWSILEVLPLRITEEEAIRRESLYKQKFCTRLFGYNSN